MNQVAEPLVVVYQATNMVNGHRYIGFSARGLAQRADKHRAMARQGRGHHFHAAIRKYGAENFTFELMGDFGDDEELAKLYEIEAILKYKPEYNISRGGDGHHVAEESRKKISAANKGRKPSAYALQRSAEARLAKPMTAETKRKISEALTGQTRSKETRDKMGRRVISEATRERMAAAQRGKTHSEETRAKLRAARAMQITTEETRAKMSAALTGRPAHNRGSRHKPETIEKMRAAHFGRVPTEEARANMRAAQAANRKPVRCTTDGRVFESSTDAEQFYGLCQGAVTRVVSGGIKSTKGLHFERIVRTL
jgi:group I intron endonuclease